MIQFTSEQEEIIKQAVNHITGKESDDQVFQIQGDAGTGKTTVLFEIIKRIGIPLQRVATMTYIGQAAIVLRSKGIYNAKTAHSWLYKAEEVEVRQNGKVVMDPIYNKPLKRLQFVPRELEEIDYIVIDEAWTMPKKMKHEIERRGLKIIAVGDDWQSIYAFSGSDITLFTKFAEKMGYAKMLKIVKTYRNSQDVIDIAGNFIQKNDLMNYLNEEDAEIASSFLFVFDSVKTAGVGKSSPCCLFE